MSETHPTWLTDACAELLHTSSGRHLAEVSALGACAASASLTSAATVDALLQAAADHWAATDPADAHEHGLAILATLRQVTAAVLDGYHRSARDEATHRETERAAFVDDLLAAHPDPGHLAARAQRYGIRLSGQHTVIAARTTGLPPAAAYAVDDVLAQRFGAANTLTTLRDDELICVVAGGLRGVPAELARHLHTHLPAGSWQIAVGRTHTGLGGLATSLAEARNALHLADRLGFTTPVLHAADLLVFPVLLRDRDAITDLVTTVLGPLTQARGGAQPYLDTLAVLFDNEGNHTATARQLHVSVRAVTYRLDRIHALTGYHPGEPTQRFTLHTAVLGARLLGWPGGTNR
ncbi:PucR family transcriptional regulator [Catellatospora sichuanensis]|uniref:PucR family transcriptional regulator n=1 Tax=Catellatospora sichuanensis TaxID=1969805 RepID=UPI001181CE4C|nr:helix-turn-helix domain-containing protein [Catellatospora sichuanensis]